MKPLTRILLLLILGILLVACRDTVEVPEKAVFKEDNLPESNEPLKIGFAMDTLKEERWLKDRKLFQEAIESHGLEVEIRAANGDDALQIAQAEEMIQQGIDLLVIVPHNAEATAAIVHKAHGAGIKVIAYDRLVKNADIDLYVSFDNERVGELQAEEMLKRVPKGNYVYIGGAPTDNNAHLLKKGVFNVLQPAIDRGDIRIIYDQWTADWAPEAAYAHMSEALNINDNQIDAVIAANDATAGGVVEALDNQGLAGTIPVAGQDAELAAVRRIVDGTQMMTVYKPIQNLSERVAALAIHLANNNEFKPTVSINNGKSEVPSVLLEPIAVTADNLKEVIIADEFHTEEEVYGKE
ncbi:D-xylose ABC transporter substrate-binding protein [Planococcus halotolerans]|uniref:D-xylose ABC transporter substrate-binding protein n=1 Tax=Planococcus halotolerans TaxID=2233542 RepID=A0A365KWQ2_9BACL|nr:D-xylose ABC transporter substrate-binding protein [Planococcus halotolerans]QHJ69183.1 D-xylose ABC transporter substrate-binding protein [Planococcus halotolerans]RAZ77615.1 D-xylose ABC transporter substrate-binding protein [Planococcus halotolerans]